MSRVLTRPPLCRKAAAVEAAGQVSLSLSSEQLDAPNLVAGEGEAGFHRSAVRTFAGCLPGELLLDRRERSVTLPFDLLEEESRVEVFRSGQLEHVRNASNDLCPHGQLELR